MSKKKAPTTLKKSNPVAKHLRTYNKAVKHRDRKNDYTRKEKHKGSNSSFYSECAFTRLTA